MLLTPRIPKLLCRADQAAVAGLCVLGAIVIGIWLAAESGLRQRLIEVDRSKPNVARFQVDLNTAEPPELIQLPGVGDKLAQHIVHHRQMEGPFRDVEDLLHVPGIGRKTLENLRPYLRPLPEAQNLAGQ